MSKSSLVKMSAPSSKPVSVRQDRQDLSQNDFYIDTSKGKFKLMNLSAFGFLLRLEERKVPFETNQEFSFTFFGSRYNLGNFKAQCVRILDTNSEYTELGCEIIGEPLPTDIVTAVLEMSKFDEFFEKKLTREDSLPDSFKVKIYEAKSWLSELEKFLVSIERGFSFDSLENLDNSLQAYVQIGSKHISSYFPKLYRSLKEEFAVFDDAKRKKAVHFFREELSSLIYQAPFAERVYKKPRGYAGDFEMMNIIYRNESAGRGLFSKALHKYWVEEPSAEAVRNRADYLVRKITAAVASTSKDELTFLSVASGPAYEWQLILDKHSHVLKGKKISVHLLDQDEASLKEAQFRLKPKILRNNENVKIHFLRDRIQNVIVGAIDGNYDFIYSAGLFDYLSNPVAKAACRSLFKLLNPGGTLVIGNFNIGNPNEMIMNLALDWHLIYRSEAEMTEITTVEGALPTIEKEALDINLFSVLKK